MKQTIPYIIGDIHGCFIEYMALDAQIKAHAKKNNWDPLIVSVGDLVDRGKRSQDVVSIFLSGSTKGTHLSVLGNHEAEFIKHLFWGKPELFDEELREALPLYLDPNFLFPEKQDEKAITHRREAWLAQGGLETLESYGCQKDPSKIGRAHV